MKPSEIRIRPSPEWKGVGNFCKVFNSDPLSSLAMIRPRSRRAVAPVAMRQFLLLHFKGCSDNKMNPKLVSQAEPSLKSALNCHQQLKVSLKLKLKYRNLQRGPAFFPGWPSERRIVQSFLYWVFRRWKTYIHGNAKSENRKRHGGTRWIDIKCEPSPHI
jgi:hypothetical protein